MKIIKIIDDLIYLNNYDIINLNNFNFNDFSFEYLNEVLNLVNLWNLK